MTTTQISKLVYAYVTDWPKEALQAVKNSNIKVTLTQNGAEITGVLSVNDTGLFVKANNNKSTALTAAAKPLVHVDDVGTVVQLWQECAKAERRAQLQAKIAKLQQKRDRAEAKRQRTALKLEKAETKRRKRKVDPAEAV